MTFYDLLKYDNWYGKSDNIEIAKGKYELTTDLENAKEQIKRVWHDRNRLL
jgi:hypothetical protein